MSDKEGVNQSADNFQQWYSSAASQYDSFQHHLKTEIESLLNRHRIKYHEVTGRLKTLESFQKKCRNKNYSSPSDCTDIAGVRITVYLKSELEPVSNLIKNCFTVDAGNSLDHAEMLAPDQFGYQSIHYLVSLPEELTHHEFHKHFKELRCEIQIRTILQHAWAEIEHDRSYKFGSELPRLLQRRFKLMAGQLEVADNELDTIAKEIDVYVEDVRVKSETGDLEIEINSASLTSYLRNKLKEDFVLDDSVASGYALEHLKELGINSIKQVDELLTPEFMELMKEYDVQTIDNLVFWAIVLKFKNKAFLKDQSYGLTKWAIDKLQILGIDLDEIEIIRYKDDE